MAPQDLPTNIGRYQVTGRLGYGGMGVVYRARDPRIGRSVAIKLLSLRDEALRVRFQQEAQSAGNLKHPNIVTVYDYGEHEEQPYIVMEYIEGVTLSQHIRQGIPLSLPRKLALIEELSLALDYAHNKGIVHRDIKPANVMVDGDGVLKILDFGIARIGDSNLTQVGVMVGTPNYMSPEQILGETADRRSDIFAVGLVFYELLSYKRAFPGDSPIAVMHAITQSKPEPLEKLCPDLHPSVIAIVAKALEKEPSRRYQNLAALAADITLFKNLSWTGRGAQADQPTVHWTGPALTPLPERKTTPHGTERERVIRRRAEKLEEHLDTAQRAFDTGQYEAAVDACEQAEVIDPDEPRVADLLTRARKALTAESVRNLITQARASLEQQHPDEAAEFVARALQEAPSSVEARQAQQEIEEYKRRAQIDAERRQTIEGSLARARSSLARGDLDSAIRAAGEVLAQDPSNATAHAITRDALVAADERRQREAWEQAAQAAVREQKQAFAAGRWHEAIAALERFAPPHADVSAALVEMRAALVDLERQARIQEERRQAQLQWIADQMRLARAAFNERRFAEAVELLEAVGAIDPQVQGLAQLLQDARAGRAAAEGEARRQREIAQLVAQVDAVAAANRLDEALASINAMPASAQSHPDVVARRRDIQAKLDAKRRKDELDRRADAAVEAARREFAAGAQAAAIVKLESFSPPHPVVARARDELRAKLESMQRAEREATLKTQCQEVKKQIAAGRFAEALDRLRDMERTFGQVPEVKELLESARAGKEAAEARVRQEREIAALLDDARRLIERKDFPGAGKRIEKALGIDRTNQQIHEVRAALAVAVDQDRRRVEEEREKQAVEARRKAAAADIRKLLRKKKLDEALQSVGQALAVDANARELLDLKTTIEGAIAERSRLPQDTSPSFLSGLRAVPGWQAGLAAVAVVALVVAVAYPIYKNQSGSKETIETVTVTTMATTTIPEGVTATTTTPVGVQDDLAQVLVRIRALIDRGELLSAARALTAALRGTPQNADLVRFSGEAVDAAAARATAAKGKASSASNRPAYRNADGLMASAGQLRKANRTEQAVAEYLTAEQLFTEALKPVPEVASVATTIPVQTTQIESPTTRPTTSMPAATTSVPLEVVAPRTTSAPPTVVAASIDRATVDALLQQYAAASRTFDLDAIRGVYPDITDRQKLRVERLRKDYSFCEYTFGALQTVSSSPTEATIRIDSTESCKPKTAQRPIQIASRQIIHFRKNSSGSWSIGEVFTE